MHFDDGDQDDAGGVMQPHEDLRLGCRLHQMEQWSAIPRTDGFRLDSGKTKLTRSTMPLGCMKILADRIKTLR